MAKIYESKSFIIEAPSKPHIDRNDGGHIKICPKIKVIDRQRLSPGQAVELMRLTVVAGKAMAEAMNERGVYVGRINYQDNGNWGVFNETGPHLHIHLYGRAKNAKTHKYGQACYFPHPSENPDYYKDFKPLDQGDIKSISEKIEDLLGKDEFSDSSWGLQS